MRSQVKCINFLKLNKKYVFVSTQEHNFAYGYEKKSRNAWLHYTSIDESKSGTKI